jgi:hypothetical protein
MLFKLIDQLSKSAFTRVKWLLTALSGVLTTGLIIILES